jgi:amino-acid N-acetyltransferase
MNTQLVQGNRPVTRTPRPRRNSRPRRTGMPVTFAVRSATTQDASALHALITSHVEEGRLLPRTIEELTTHAARFVVAVRRGRIVGCAELAPLSSRVAEVRSLVAAQHVRGSGIGRVLVRELVQRARSAGYAELCAFAHDPTLFVRLDFSLVPHTWLPDKIARDCASCAWFRRCGQHALVRALRAGG